MFIGDRYTYAPMLGLLLMIVALCFRHTFLLQATYLSSFCHFSRLSALDPSCDRCLEKCRNIVDQCH